MKLYSTPFCGKCKVVKKILEEKKISFEEVDLTKDIDSQEYLLSIGRLALPVVERNDGTLMDEDYNILLQEINKL